MSDHICPSDRNVHDSCQSAGSRTIHLLQASQNGDDGGYEGERLTEALFPDTHRSRRTTPVTKANSGAGSSWDKSDSESDSEAGVV